jgi:hypothetical protein
MTSQREIRADDSSTAREWRAWWYLGGQRAPIILAIIAVVTGTALSWSWLVAVGIAPILLSILPCLVMCGLGLCMNRLIGRSCGTSSSPRNESRLGDNNFAGPGSDNGRCRSGLVRGHVPGTADERTRGEPAEIGNPRKETENAING